MKYKRNNNVQLEKGKEVKVASLFEALVFSFLASFCIMTLELTASRLIAGYLGSSIYTWTSVIGIVLAGISLGNYWGGRLSDRFQPQRMLVLVFLVAAIACSVIPVLNKVTGEALLYVEMSWPLKILLHVTAIFFIPSICLGMIGPVVAKWALDQGLATGKTVGDVYSFSALGSVAGTFVTGFFLIPTMGTILIMLSIAGLLAFLGIFILMRVRLISRFVAMFALMTVAVVGFQGWGFATSPALQTMGIHEQMDTIYVNESQYSLIRVQETSQQSNFRSLKLDQLVHSKVNMNDPAHIYDAKQYNYIKLYGAITDMVFADQDSLQAFFLGGGGYVMPRYVEKHWEGSFIEVAEIDPLVTQAAIDYLKLDPNHTYSVYHQDARNRVEDILRDKKLGKAVQKFDVIYGDTFNDVSVPYHLTTKQFNDKLYQIMSDNGVYLINLVDAFDSSRFLGAIYNTLKETFPYVYVLRAGNRKMNEGSWHTFILINSMKELDISKISSDYAAYNVLSEKELKHIETRSQGLVLTDDFVPVENLLAGIVSERGSVLDHRVLASEMMRSSVDLVRSGQFDRAIKQYKKILTLDSSLAVGVYHNIGTVYASQGELNKALEFYKKSLSKDPHFEPAKNKIKAIETYLAQKGEVNAVQEARVR